MSSNVNIQGQMAQLSLTPTASIGGSKIDMLTHQNYFSWMPRAKAILKKEKQWKYIDPKNKATYIDLKEGEELTNFEDALDFLGLFITDEVLQDVKHLTTAPEVWEFLDQKYTRMMASQQALYLQRLESTVFDEKTEDMQAYQNRISRLIAQVRSCNGTVSDVSYSGYLLRGLPRNYDTVKIVLNIQRGDPESIKSALLGEEARIQEESIRGARPTATSSAHALAATSGSNGGNSHKKKCYHCGKEGHLKRDCRKLKAEKRQETESRDGYQSKDSSGKVGGSGSPTKLTLMAHRAKDTVLQPARQWYFDSGASDHITGDRDVFTDFTLITPFPITLGDGSQVFVTGKGTVILNVNGTGNIAFTDVLYSGEFRDICLLSVSQLAKKGAILTFVGENVMVEYSGTAIATGILNHRIGLYELDQYSSRVYRSTVPRDEDELRIQHRRYGHINNDYVQKSVGHIEGLDKPLKGNAEADCDICSLAKSHRQGMKLTDDKELEPMDLWAIDHWGPIPIPSLTGNINNLGVVDYGSHWRTALYGTDRKGFFEPFTDLVVRMETQTGRKLKAIRLDNAPEFFKSTKFRDWAKSRGTELQFVTPYTPEQNGMVERANQTNGDGTRANLVDSGLPPEFWQYAMDHSILAQNYCYKPAIGKTPYEAIFGKKPSSKKLVIFGTLGFVHIPKENTEWNKVLSKAWPGIVVGYEGSGYRVWDPVRRELIITNHVELKEGRKGVELLQPQNINNLQEETEKIFRTGSTPEVSDTSILLGDTIVVKVPSTSEEEPDDENSDVEFIPTPPTDNHNKSPVRAIPNIEESSTLSHGSETPIRSSIIPANTEITGGSEMMPPPRLWRGKPVGPPTRSSSRIRGESTTPEASGSIGDQQYTANIAIAGRLEDNIPKTLEEALAGPDREKWLEAIRSELRSLLRNHTWDLVKRQNDQEVVDSKWLFKIKDDGRFKARLVARGFTQTYGLDYFETYAPVARFASIRLLFALAARFGLRIQQMDVDTAFLYGNLDEEIFMEQPPGFVEEGLVCRLRRSLYGLKQAPRVWYQVIDEFFRSIGLERSAADPAVYIEGSRAEGEFPLIVAIYVDDLIIVHKDLKKIDKVKEALNSRFNMKDLGEVKNLLGMEVHHLKDGSIFINQPRYIDRLLKRFGMENCKAIDTPMAPRIVSSDEEFDVEVYQRITGGLMWPSLGTRPDIAFAVGYLARWNSKPTTAHNVAQRRVLRYLKGTKHHGILFKAHSKSKLEAFSDADWAGDIVDRKSTSGNCFTLFEGVVVWAAVKQQTIATSSVEAEYIAVALSVKEALWLLTWLKEVGFDLSTIAIQMDSNGALDLAKNAQFSQRTKHIDIRHHFIRDHIEKGDISLKYLPTDAMTADILTKPLEKVKFARFREQMGVVDIEA